MIDILEKILIVLFMEGLDEPLKGWINIFNPNTLMKKIKKAWHMEMSTSSSKLFSNSKPSLTQKEKNHKLV